MHPIYAAAQLIEPNTIPINDIIGRLQPPAPDNNHIQQARDYTIRDRQHIINTHVEATNRYYNTISSLLQEGPFEWWFQRCFSSTMIIYGRDDETSYPLAYMWQHWPGNYPIYPMLILSLSFATWVTSERYHIGV